MMGIIALLLACDLDFVLTGFAAAFGNFVRFICVDIAEIECDVSGSVAGVGRD
jgi:hypothetical protein